MQVCFTVRVETFLMPPLNSEKDFTEKQSDKSTLGDTFLVKSIKPGVRDFLHINVCSLQALANRVQHNAY